MNKFFLIFLLFINFSLILFLAPKAVFSDELDDITKKINDLQNSLNESRKSSAPLENQLKNMQSQLAGIENRVLSITQDIANKKTIISKGYNELRKQKNIFNRTVRDYYIKNYLFSPFLVFISSGDAANITRSLTYQKKGANQDKAIITNIAIKITSLEEQKKSLEGEESKLVVVKQKLDSEKVEVEKLVKGARDFQSTLTSQIAALSAQQQQILDQRLSALGIPRSAGASQLYCTDDRKLNPGFSPAFAFFTYGIPHYVGMNQYGAYGRSKAGQDYKTILNAYFQSISIECRDIPGSIDVQGNGSMNFEDYIKGVVNKEMGADLPEALKAQAIAARSFAMNEPKPICTSQSCQVYSPDRREAVNSAVDTTGVNACGAGKAEFVVSGGNIVKTWFASTFGGYSHTSAEIWGGSTSYTKNFADTTGPVNSFSDLSEKAYDKESACFYTAQGWRDQYGKSAWLKPEEVADIANVILLVRKDSSKKCFVYQPDKPPPPPDPKLGCPTTDNWSADRVRQELGGGAISTATSVEVTGVDWTSGRTTEVRINGVSFDGNEFKNYFNIRAPANIQIVGPLYNTETK